MNINTTSTEDATKIAELTEKLEKLNNSYNKLTTDFQMAFNRAVEAERTAADWRERAEMLLHILNRVTRTL